MLPHLLNQIPRDQEIGSVTADGAYDTEIKHLLAAPAFDQDLGFAQPIGDFAFERFIPKVGVEAFTGAFPEETVY